jgi:hypothetical protein
MGSHDHLQLEGTAPMRKLLPEGDHICFSCALSKINRKQKTQKRVLVITDTHLYNLKPKSYACQRAIPLEKVSAVLFNNLTDTEFVVQVTSEYDYFFRSEFKIEIIHILADAVEKKTGQSLKTKQLERVVLRSVVKTRVDLEKEKKSLE